MKNKEYIAFLESVKGEGGYGVIVPDLPGFSSYGDTHAEAVKNATEGLASHIKVMKEFGENIQNPRSLEEIKKNWDGWQDWNRDVDDYLVVLLPVLPPYGTEKVLISMDVGLIARIDRVSKNRSAFFASAVEHFLDAGTTRKQA
ncbi:MAG: type II toxin-antitoxin system HicB family antitoxin [Puniceicoccales bacterium]|jgi:predicted RNase H-like HicB family nuclease|nr:type II toxin-antitoxin system HicB family antitoxin [Puniceicoccales bacterium]